MTWSLPDNWVLPQGEQFFVKFKAKGELYSMTEPDYIIAEKYLKNKRGSIDVGAHIGTTAARYAANFNNVYAFEPVYMKECKTNVGHLDNVAFYEIALSDKVGQQEMFAASGNTGATAILNEDNKDILKKSVLRFNMMAPKVVNTKPLDDYMFTDIDFIKLDTEGYVLPILKGMVTTLEVNQYPLLQIEFNKLNPHTEECFDFLKKLGYNLVDQYHVDHFFERK